MEIDLDAQKLVSAWIKDSIPELEKVGYTSIWIVDTWPLVETFSYKSVPGSWYDDHTSLSAETCDFDIEVEYDMVFSYKDSFISHSTVEYLRELESKNIRPQLSVETEFELKANCYIDKIYPKPAVDNPVAYSQAWSECAFSAFNIESDFIDWLIEKAKEDNLKIRSNDE